MLQAKIKELELLTAASRMLNSTLNLDQLLRVIMKIVKKAVKAETVFLSMLDADGENLTVELTRGKRGGKMRGLKIPVGEGIMGTVARRRKPLIVGDVREHKRYYTAVEATLVKKPRSVLAIPLTRRGQLIGVLEAVNHKGKGSFTENDLSLAITLGEHIAIAVANARLLRRAKRSGLKYSLLSRVGADMGKSLSLDGVLERILKNLKKLIPFDAAAIFVLDREEKRMVSRLHFGYSQGREKQINVKSDEGVVSLAAKQKRGIIVDDVKNNDMYVEARRATRSEMVAPIMSHGEVIGVFNLEDDRVGAYNDENLQLLEAFAGQASVAMERARLYEERGVKLEIEKELRVARTVQEFFTPRRSKVMGQFRIAGVNYPSLEVSGDYHDHFPIKGGLQAFAIADVAGKGVPASLIMSSLRATLHTAAPYVASARQLALRANMILMETVRPQDFVTAFIGVLDPKTGELTYCNAGHNPPVLMSSDGAYRLLEKGGPVLGVFEDIPLEEGRLKIGREVLVCYTDGATEGRNERDEEYGEERLVEAIRSSLHLTPSRLCRALMTNLKGFLKDGEQTDDITFLVLKRKDPPGKIQ